ncbi:MAG: T9SS type A sorting domain-containing protein [Bacteroidetes bacterium]|nr:T9SS type A sorting domain-containing protein [Bacteroidota bacterium]
MKKYIQFYIFLICLQSTMAQNFERAYLGGIVPNLQFANHSIDDNGKSFHFLNNNDNNNSTPDKYSIFVTNSNGDSLWEKIIAVPSESITQLDPTGAIEFNNKYIFTTKVPIMSQWPSGKQILVETDLSGSVTGVDSYTTMMTGQNSAIYKSHSGNFFYTLHKNQANYMLPFPAMGYIYNEYLFIKKYQSINNPVWTNTKLFSHSSNDNYYSYISTFKPTLDDGYAMTYIIMNKFDSNYVEKYNANGNLQWQKKISTLINTPFPVNTNVWDMFCGSDTTYYLTIGLMDSLNTSTGSIQVVQLDKNGNLLNSIQLPQNVQFYKGGVETSNHKLIFSYYTMTPQPNVSMNSFGLVSCDKNLGNMIYHPAVLNNNTFIYSDLKKNNCGGAFMTFKNLNPPNYYNLAGFTTLSFDSLFNTYPFKVIAKTVLDDNKNCILDGQDIKMVNASVVLQDSLNNNYYAFSDTAGNYKINIPYGTYTISNYPSGYKAYECPPTGKINFAAASSTPSLNCMFFDTIIPNVEDFNLMLSGSWFAQNDTSYAYALVKNEGTMQSSCLVSIQLDSCLQLISTYPPYFSNVNNLVTFSVTNLTPDSIAMLTFYFNTGINSPIGSPVNIFGSVACSGDINLSNNNDTISGFIIAGSNKSMIQSFDPNNSINVAQPSYVNDNKELIYRVKFQNTLPSVAKSFSIIDTIDNNLDISTLKVIHTSHDKYSLKQKKGNCLMFRFDNINLANKQVNDSLSHGEIIYSIKFKPNVTPNSVVKSQATLFFDYDMVITNQTQNFLRANVTSLIKNKISDKKEKISVYPNPTNGLIYIQNLKNENTLFTITDMQGIIIKEKEKLINRQVDLSGLKTGIYFLTLSSDMEISNFKVIVFR